MSLFRKSVEAMVGYVPGEQPKAGTKIIKLNTNENPYPPSPNVLPAIQAELEHGAARLRLYSDPHATLLREAASEVTGVPAAQILHGNGSDELLALLFRAFLEPGDSIAYPYPTYVLYRTLAAAAGGHASCIRPAPGSAAALAGPLPEVLMRLHRSLKQAFDPDRIFNPGRLYPDL
ncbi:MAG TPA: aminotransferase class I/II-fold pyridoxal phosphate-dependent enzyme [Rubrivivax sp.]|nr:aminotransferase class I/II-fold pyridoxal phosphate-dependent enzyme [Rubrivivax sp.]